MKLILTFRAYLRQSLSAADILDEIYQELKDVADFSQPVHVEIPHAPENPSENLHTVIRDGVICYIVREIKAEMDCDCGNRFDLIEKYGQKAVFAEIQEKVFLDREPL
jgi:hypothetical protein